jgi:alpha-mannosidase
MKAEEYYENHFAPFEITVVSKETVIELMEQYAQQERKQHAIELLKYLYDSTAEEFSQEIMEAIGAENYEQIYDLWTNHQNQER